jgi:hypothetical protein
LYALVADPNEHKNLIAAEPAVARRMKERLDATTAAMRAAAARPVEMDRGALAALKQLGYLSGAPAPPQDVPPGERKNPADMMHVRNACDRAKRLPRGKLEEQNAAGASMVALTMRIRLGLAYQRLGKPAGAAQQWELVLKNDPTNALIHHRIADPALRARDLPKGHDAFGYAKAVEVASAIPAMWKGDRLVVVFLTGQPRAKSLGLIQNLVASAAKTKDRSPETVLGPKEWPDVATDIEAAIARIREEHVEPPEPEPKPEPPAPDKSRRDKPKPPKDKAGKPAPKPGKPDTTIDDLIDEIDKVPDEPKKPDPKPRRNDETF